MYLVGFKCNIKASIHILIGQSLGLSTSTSIPEFISSLFLISHDVYHVLVFIFYAHYTFLI
jgi:hypothetical protein